MNLTWSCDHHDVIPLETFIHQYSTSTWCLFNDQLETDPVLASLSLTFDLCLELVDFIWAAARPQLACYLMLFCVNIVPATAQPTSKKSWCSLERWINFIVTLYVTHSRLSETQKLDIKLIKTCSNSRTRRQIFSFESFCIRWHLFLLQPASKIYFWIKNLSDSWLFQLLFSNTTRNSKHYQLSFTFSLLPGPN